jgi:TatD DNase family protein
MLIDIGVNLSNKRFKEDVENILERATQAQISKLVLTGTSIAESHAVLALCEQYSEGFPNMLFATCGIHPHDADDLCADSIDRLRALATHSQIVAIGETGLDFNRNFSSPKAQQLAFEAQLELAIELNMPLFMHERDAAPRQLEILKHYRDQITEGVIHCFTSDKKTLFSYLDLDLHIGITGWVCDERRGLELQKIVHNIPLQRLMIETDAPYLLPRNMPSKPSDRRNEPAFLPYVLQAIAEARIESADEIAAATTATAMQFFNFDQSM